ALAELRHTLGVFRGDAGAFEADDAPRAPTPTIPAIAALVDDVRAGGVAVTLSPLPDAVGIGAAEQAAAYRIVQEALTNAVRHAAGEPVSVGIRRDPSTLVITVVNSLAAGAATPVIEGGGLRGMRERVVALGGTLEVERRPASFVVTAALPGTGRDA
ncbi:MAG: ATP-binding protein, partial [Propioniciclava sp.]